MNWEVIAQFDRRITELEKAAKAAQQPAPLVERRCGTCAHGYDWDDADGFGHCGAPLPDCLIGPRDRANVMLSGGATCPAWRAK